MSGAVGRAFTGTGQVVAAGGPPVGVVGLSVLDTSGAPNTVSVYDGTSTAGVLVAMVTVGVNGYADLNAAVPRMCSGGIFVNGTGAVKGTVWLV